ncbi:MAG: ABC transporter substrate-binding protein [Candidatus Hydrothermarchaeota archaeon]
MKRRDFLKLGIGMGTTALLGGFAACLGPKTVELPAIRYGGQYYPGEFLLYGKPDFWSKYGIKVDHKIFSSGGENNEALIAGIVDINCGADTRTISLFNAIPEQALIIGTVQRGNRYTTIVRADSDYESWEDLKGKKVATRFGTGAEGVLRKYYKREGYNWEDFEYVNLKVEEMISSLEKGLIEAFTAWEPTPAIAEARGIGKVLRTYGDVALVPASIHTKKEFAYKNEDSLIRFLAAHLDKADLIKNNPKEASKIASSAARKKGIEVPPEAFEKVFNRINFQIEFGNEVIEAIYDTAEFMVEAGKITKIPKLAWDTSFVEKAKELRKELL